MSAIVSVSNTHRISSVLGCADSRSIFVGTTDSGTSVRRAVGQTSNSNPPSPSSVAATHYRKPIAVGAGRPQVIVGVIHGTNVGPTERPFPTDDLSLPENSPLTVETSTRDLPRSLSRRTTERYAPIRVLIGAPRLSVLALGDATRVSECTPRRRTRLVRPGQPPRTRFDPNPETGYPRRDRRVPP
jgi:hypothetical protein